MIEQEDTELIQESLNGNARTQEILYDKYVKIIRDFIRDKYSSYHDIEDDVSEIIIKVFTKLETFDSQKSKFKSWVFSIAKNHMVDKWRCNTITLTSGASCTFSITADNDYNNAAYFTSNCDTGIMTFDGSSNMITINNSDIEFENCSSISYITNQLTPQDYTLLDMKYVQGYDYNEIGKEFNVTSSTISNRVNYIKTKLKKNNTEIIYE
jgi:RNA polymerase sigma factor (sigma-70 family)